MSQDPSPATAGQEGTWTGRAMAIDRRVAAPAEPVGPRPGIRPVVVAIARGLLADGLRISLFLLGAWLLGAFAIGIAAFALVQPGSGLPWPDEASRAARELALQPWTSLVPLAQILAITGYLGLRLPVRAIAASTIGERTIRRWVAGIGAGLVGIVSWLVLPMSLDWVLAIGYSAAPLVFALAALRGPADPPVARGWRPYLLLAAAHAVGAMAMLLVWTVTPPVAADLAPIGEPSSFLGDDAARFDVLHGGWGGGDSADRFTRVYVVRPGGPGAPVVSMRVEAWPATVRDGALVIGPAPVVGIPMAIDGDGADLEWTMPTPRVRALVLTVVVGITPDGRRVILDEEPEITPTPPWRGPLLWWWLGG